MRLRSTAKLFTALTALGLTLASPLLAQGMGGGMGGGGMGGGGMGGQEGGGGGHRGGKRSSGDESSEGAAPTATPQRPAPAVISLAQRLTGVVIIAGQGRKATHLTIPSDKPDVSVVYVTRGGLFEMDGLNLVSSAQAGLVDDTRNIGINSALLINEGSRAAMTGGTITTSGQGGNAIYAASEGAVIKLQDTKIITHGSGAFGVQLAERAILDATNVTLATESDHASAISAGSGSRVTLKGGHFTTEGQTSPVLESAGMIEASDITGSAGRSDAVVITGRNVIRLTNSHLSADGYGARIYTPAAGDDAGGLGGPPSAGGRMGGRRHHPDGDHGGVEPGGADHTTGQPAGNKAREHAPDRDSKTPDIKAQTPANGPGLLPPSADMDDDSALSLSGGQLSAREALFFVSNIQTSIALDNVELHSESGMLVKSAAASWGTLGQNGGDVRIDARHQILTGDCFTDVISHITLDLHDGSHLTGKTTRNTDVVLDATSTWDLTDDTNVGKLTLEGVTTPDQIRNIVSHGHILTYDKKRNPWLNRQTYTLADGGQLVPGL